jgi:D-serine deaminase-like pyridoxal phosphate-dependent protein
MLSIHQLQTPCLLLDEPKLRRNAARMRDRLSELGVPLRPHFKTLKCLPAIEIALAGQPRAVTVSTLAEAEYCVSHGINDVFYAVGIAPGKLARVAELRARGADLTVLLDGSDQLRQVQSRAAELGATIPAMIEVDTDGHRSGLTPDSPKIVEIARRLRDHPGTSFRGLMTHAGASYDCRTPESLAAIAEQERAGIVRAAGRLRAAGVDVPRISVGSTPTALSARDLTGVSEVRAGVYLAFDLVMAGIGVCGLDDIAVSVLTTVIGQQAERGWIITDAGWMALSRDRGTSGQSVDFGFGVVCDEAGRPIGDLIVQSTNQEHGILANRTRAPLDLASFPVGRRLRILPNHACATGGQHRNYHVLDSQQRVQAVWERCSGW